MNNMKNILALLTTVFALTLAGAAQAEDPTPDALVRDVTSEVLDIVKKDKELQTGNPKRVQQLVETKIVPHFNFGHMTAFAMGRDWKQASAEQQKTLTDEFRNLLVRTYSNAFAGYKNQTVTVKPTRMQPADTEATVRTLVNQPGGQPVQIDYTLERTPNGWKVYDVTVAGSSLVTVYRTKFHDQVQAGGVDGLVKFLLDSNRAPAPSVAKK